MSSNEPLKFICAIAIIASSALAGAQGILPTPSPSPVPRAQKPVNPSVFVDADNYSSVVGKAATLSGHVKIIRGNEILTCDKASVNTSTGEVIAEGNVVFESPTEFVRASKMDYNFRTHRGLIRNGFIQMGQQTIEGEEIYKSGDSDYEAKNATYTSCVNCPPSWKLSGSDISASKGSYAYIKNPVVRVYNIPILWLPYVAIPIKNERQSGLLAPFYGIGNKDGTTLGDSYFWAIDQSKDATFTETHYSGRGWKEGLEYRYVTDKNSRGLFRGAFIKDNFFGGDQNYLFPDPRYNTYLDTSSDPLHRATFAGVDRGSLHYEHHYELPDGFVNNVNVNWVSDAEYPQDFPREVPFAGDPALENRVNLAKNTENTHSSIDVDVYENLLKGDPVGSNADAVHRVPEIRYSIMPLRLFNSNALLSLDADYSNFARAYQSYDETNGIPGFQRSLDNPVNGVPDRYRTGQRVIMKPDLMYPLNVDDFLDVVPDASYEEDYYSFGYSAQPTASRRYLRAGIQTRTRLSSVFGGDGLPNATRYKHEIIPEVNYTYVPWIYQDTHQFLLGPKLATNYLGGTYLPHYTSTQPITEFDNIQFDYRDRLADLNLITFGLTNVLIQKRFHDGSSEYKQIVRHRLTQSYDFYTAYGPDAIKQPWSQIRSLLEVKLDTFIANSDVSYYPYQNAASNSTSLGLKDARGDSILVGYSQIFPPIVDPTTGLSSQISIPNRSEFASLTLYYISTYLDISGTSSWDIVNGWRQAAYSVNAVIKPPGKCWGLGIQLEQSLTGATAISASLPIFFGNGQAFSVGRPPGA